MERQVKPGTTSSEYAKARRAESAGFVILSVGALVALVSLPLRDTLAGGVGVFLAAVGAYLIGHTASAYAHARGAVKAAASQPPASVNMTAPPVNLPAIHLPPTTVHATVKSRPGI